MPTPECEAIRLWRDAFKLNLSQSWKRDVEITIKDIELWRTILAGWYYFDKQGKKHKKAPGIKPLLDEYERLQMDKANRDNEASALPTRGREGLSEGRGSNVSQVRSEPPSLYFRVG